MDAPNTIKIQRPGDYNPMTTEQLSEPTSTESTVADTITQPRTRRKVSEITRRAKSDYHKAWGNIQRIQCELINRLDKYDNTTPHALPREADATQEEREVGCSS